MSACPDSYRDNVIHFIKQPQKKKGHVAPS